MANSSLVIQAKNDILIALQNDERIVEALDLHDDESAEDLIGVRLFPHWFVSETQEAVKTYICVEAGIDALEISRASTVNEKVYDIATIKVYVISHQNDLYMNKAGVSAIRTDYLSCLIDEKLNGSTDFGLGTLQRISNNPFSLKDNIYRYREIVFRAYDFNDDMCEVL